MGMVQARAPVLPEFGGRPTPQPTCPCAADCPVGGARPAGGLATYGPHSHPGGGGQGPAGPGSGAASHACRVGVHAGLGRQGATEQHAMPAVHGLRAPAAALWPARPAPSPPPPPPDLRKAFFWTRGLNTSPSRCCACRRTRGGVRATWWRTGSMCCWRWTRGLQSGATCSRMEAAPAEACAGPQSGRVGCTRHPCLASLPFASHTPPIC